MSVQKVIDFVNMIRGEYKLPPITELVEGRPGDAENDIVVKSITFQAPSYIQAVAFYDLTSVFSYEEGKTRLYETPEDVAAVMQQFDRKQLPELIQTSKW